MEIANKSVCRGCLQEIKPLEQQYSFGWTEIKDLFVQCTSISIPPDEHYLPQQICLECYTNCERWFSFKSMCVDVNTHLQATVPLQPVTDYQLPIRIKEEVIDDDYPMEYTAEETTLNEDLETFSFGNLVEDTQDFSPVVVLERLDPQLIAQLSPKSVLRSPVACDNITCPVCQLRCPDSARLMDHLKKHYSTDNPQCPLCSQTFKRSSKIYPHIMSEHMDTTTTIQIPIPADKQAAKLTCPICKKKFEQLYVHIAEAHVVSGSRSCPICKKVFAEKANLKAHFVKHTGETPCECLLCGLTFKYGTSLKRHKRNVHGIGVQIKDEASEEAKFSVPGTPETGFECKLCGKFLFSDKSLIHHKSVIHGISRPNSDVQDITNQKITVQEKNNINPVEVEETPAKKKCPLCKKKVKKLCLHLAKAHLTHGDRSCPICKKVFRKKVQLRYHLVIHTDEKPFQCELCPQAFKFGSSLMRHMRNVHGIVTHDVPDIKTQGSVVQDINSLSPIQEEEEKSIKQKCPICKQKFERLWVHLTNAHLKLGSRSCPLCNKGFTERAHLQAHFVVHTGERPFPCDLCPNTFGFRTSLRRHKRDVHGIANQQKVGKVKFECKLPINSKPPLTCDQSENDGDKGFKCPLCDNAYSQMGNLAEHFVVHTNERPFQCKYCPEDFRYRSNVSRHVVRSHPKKSVKDGYHIKAGSAFLSSCPWESMGITVSTQSKSPVKALQMEREPRFYCQLCNGVFSSQRSLENHHQNFHLSLQCDRCKKTYPTETALESHSRRCAKVVVKQETEDAVELLPCLYCQKQFMKPYTLKRHIRSYHQEGDH